MHEGQHVEGADPRMLPSMYVHVDPRDGLLRAEERRLGDCVGFADEGDDASVVVRVHLDVEDPDSRRGLYGGRDAIDDVPPATFGEVRNTFNEPHALASRSARRAEGR